MLQEILTIRNYPNLQKGQNASFGNKLTILLKSYGLVFLSLLFIAAPVMVLTDKFVVAVLHFHSIQNQDKETFRHMFQKTGYLKGLIYICLVGPILEESVFRLGLSFKKQHICISLVLALLLFGSAIPGIKHLKAAIGIFPAIAVWLGIPVMVFFVCKKLLPNEIILSANAKKWLIITSLALFSLMHVSNYSPLQWPIIWVYPLYVVPQLCMGWMITYVRFKNGFIWGIALHCIINSGSMLLSSAYQEPVTTKPALHQTKNTKKPATDTSNRLKKK